MNKPKVQNQIGSKLTDCFSGMGVICSLPTKPKHNIFGIAGLNSWSHHDFAGPSPRSQMFANAHVAIPEGK
jgi:hypothetical protein